MANIEFSMPQIREFVKKDYPSVSARIAKSLLQRYDNDLHDILVWWQSKGDEYRNNTLLVDAVADFTASVTPNKEMK